MPDNKSSTKNTKKFVDILKAKRFSLMLLLVVCLSPILYLLYQSGALSQSSPAAIRDWVLSFGWLAPLVFLVMFTLVPLTLFPDALLAVAAGMAFGLVEGAFLTWLGAMMGATLSFYISRNLGQNTVQRLLKRAGHHHHKMPAFSGFVGVLILRLIPLVPFDVISYGAGLTQIRYLHFIVATALGIVPGVVIYVNLGDKLFNWYSVQFICAIGMLIALSVLSWFGSEHLRKKHNQLT